MPWCVPGFKRYLLVYSSYCFVWKLSILLIFFYFFFVFKKFQQSIKLIDVTEESVKILKAVQEICGSDNSWKNNFTFTHFVDIFKGCKTQKVKLHSTIYNY